MEISKAFYTEIKVEYKNEGFSAMKKYSFSNQGVEVYKGLIHGTTQLFIGVYIKNLGINVYSCGKFAETIEKLCKQKKATQITHLCLEKLISNKKVFNKFHQNIYSFGYLKGAQQVKNELRGALGFLVE